MLEQCKILPFFISASLPIHPGGRHHCCCQFTADRGRKQDSNLSPLGCKSSVVYGLRRVGGLGVNECESECEFTQVWQQEGMQYLSVCERVKTAWLTCVPGQGAVGTCLPRCAPQRMLVSPGITVSTPGPCPAEGQGPSTLRRNLQVPTEGICSLLLSPPSLIVSANILAYLTLCNNFPLPHLLPSNSVSLQKPENLKKKKKI